MYVYKYINTKTYNIYALGPRIFFNGYLIIMHISMTISNLNGLMLKSTLYKY